MEGEAQVRVVLDGRMAFHSGIGRYVRELCHELLKHPGELSLSLLVDPVLAARTRAAIGVSETIDFPAKVYTVREHLQGSWICESNSRRASLFHFPHYNAPWLLPRNSVVTIHDLIHFEDPDFYGHGRVRLAFRLLRRASRRAGHLIAVSRSTQDALEALLPETRGKITTIHHGVDERFRPQPPAVIQQLKLRSKVDSFFLYVGNSKPHKNLCRVLEAFERVRGRFQHVQLILVGVEPGPSLAARQGIRFLREVPDEQLTCWYNAAQALVMPSLSEGFGFPALEAMACGTPVIGSNRPAPVEVIGEGGLLVDPQDTQELAHAMMRVLSDGGLRARLRERGLRRARRFSWRQAAQQTIDVYRHVAPR